MINKHKFADVEAYNQIDEGRFDLPPMARRRSIEVGELAQLATSDDAHFEVWAEVRERIPSGYRAIIDVAPFSETGCPVAVGDVVEFNAFNVCDIYKRRAVGPDSDYEDLFADAQTLKARKYWDPVLLIEDAAIAKRMPENMRGSAGAARLAEYLARHPFCVSCEIRGIEIEATAAVYLNGPEHGDGDDNLEPLCRGSIYVLTARQMGWPVRGCDLAGWPNDPERND